jgi:hypothetical protein
MMRIMFLLLFLTTNALSQNSIKGSTVLPKEEAAAEIVTAMSKKEKLPVVVWSDSLKVYQLGIKEQSNKKERVIYVTMLFIFVDKHDRISFTVTKDKITKDRDIGE